MTGWRTVKRLRHWTVDLKPLCGVDGGVTDDDAAVCTDCLDALRGALIDAWA